MARGLARQNGGETFIVERNGHVVAVLSPDADVRKRTVRNLLAMLTPLTPVDEEFANDIEAAISCQTTSQPPP